MADETTTPPPVPVGWVRLTMEDGRQYLCPSNGMQVTAEDHGGAFVWYVNDDHSNAVVVVESPAEVAALIAEAQRAQRRADAVPAMAAVMVASSAGYGYIDAIEESEQILDAIEAREREAGR